MGAFYGSVYVKSEQVDGVKDVLEGLASRNRKFLLAPAINGWVTIYPNDHGQDDRVSKLIAKKIDDPILQVAIHDDDVFFYSYYQDHKLVDRFNSCPDYFEPASKRMRTLLLGKPERLARLFGRPEDIHKLEAVLEQMRGRPLFASKGFDDFVELLRLPHASTSYEYLMAGETDGIDDWDQFVHFPDRTEEKKLEQEAAARVQREKDLLKEAGQLLCELTMGKTSTNLPNHLMWCADSVNGLFTAATQIGMQSDIPLQQLVAPWKGKATATDINLGPNAHCMATSPKGELLAVGYASQDQRAELWSVQEQSVVLTIEHTSVVNSVAFSIDARVLYTMSWTEVVGTDLESKQRVSEFKIENGRAIDVHSGRNMLAVTMQESASIVDLETKRERVIRLGRYQDLSGLREVLQGQMAKQMDELGSDWMINQTKQTMEQLEIPADSVVGKRIREKTEQQMNDVLSGKAFEHMTESTFQPESFFSVIFADSGKFVCCGTTAGIRVFETDKLLDSVEGDIAPKFFVEPGTVLVEYGSSPSFFYAMVDDPGNRRIIFGGMGGVIQSLDLNTGVATDLMAIPGKPAIMQMRLVGRLLFCKCQPGFPETSVKRNPPLMQVWNLDAFAVR